MQRPVIKMTGMLCIFTVMRRRLRGLELQPSLGELAILRCPPLGQAEVLASSLGTQEGSKRGQNLLQLLPWTGTRCTAPRMKVPKGHSLSESLMTGDDT